MPEKINGMPVDEYWIKHEAVLKHLQVSIKCDRYQRNPPVPDSAPGSGMETPQKPSLQESSDSIDKIK